MDFSYMKYLLIFVFFLASLAAHGDTLTQQEILGIWIPSGEIPVAKNVTLYQLQITSDLSATYTSLEESPTKFQCKSMPRESQKAVFIFHCFYEGQHTKTLTLSGWVSAKNGGKRFYGYEYFLGWPEPGATFGGMPVSFKPNGT
jgi:hypothetical protein